LKPFEPAELHARIDSHLRRSSRAAADSTSLRIAGLQIDIASQKAVLLGEGAVPQDLNLTRIEFKLLVLFLRNPGKIYSRAELLKQVWGEGTHVSEHTVDTHISSLRKKIGGARCQLKSIAKQGYCVELVSS
jgi:DNA-binding response OmpR family regulator